MNLDKIRARIDAASKGPWQGGEDGLVWAPRLGDPVSASTEQADAEFIAHARTDIPALLAEVERLRGLLGAEQRAHQEDLSQASNVIRALEAELAWTQDRPWQTERAR